jgi:hypothetical protein
MIRSRALSLRSLLATFTLGLCTLAPVGEARADDTIKHPGDHPRYNVEVEPHGLLGWDTGFYGSNGGFGIGARVSIPIVENGFIKTINNSVAISFGGDLVHYGARCGKGDRFDGYDCSANYLLLPVAMQWNFFVHQKWSVFGEPGLYIYHGFFDACDVNGVACYSPTATGIRPAFYVGGRYHFNEHIALTMRIGYPTFSVGVSFM